MNRKHPRMNKTRHLTTNRNGSLAQTASNLHPLPTPQILSVYQNVESPTYPSHKIWHSSLVDSKKWEAFKAELLLKNPYAKISESIL